MADEVERGPASVKTRVRAERSCGRGQDLAKVQLDIESRPKQPPASLAVDLAPVLIAVPLYRAPHLVPGLCRALSALGEEIRALNGQVVLINDSPDDEDLRAVLAEAAPALGEAVDAEVLVNAANLGFVRTANRALRLGEARGADVILLNSDAIPTPGAFTEMAAVARSDPMISVVSPRSNNATLCNSPYPDRFRGLDAEAALQSHLSVARYLPAATYVPTAVGFCLYVRGLMIREFGVFDEVYGDGYNEENDFIMRCNRAGYRAALANHAFVHHLGSASFSQSAVSSQARETVNRAILLDRYPQYDPAVQRYFSSVEFRTQWLLAGLAPEPSGRLRVLMDARNMGVFHNGTFEHARALLTAFGKAYGDRFALYLACTPAVAAFHRLDTIPGMTLCDPDSLGDEPFAVAFRIAQPFKFAHLQALGALAPLTGFLFLDTIAMDCLDLDVEDYHRVWSWMTQTTALIGFNSAFTGRQFRQRFSLPPDVVDFVSLCSTDVTEYAGDSAGAAGEPVAGTGYLLVVGNHYAHKHVAPMVAALRANTRQPLVVLGAGGASSDPDVALHRAGELEEPQVTALYEGADAVVFPSHYEGFGLPILHALARGKPVFARDLPPAREMKARCAQAVNLHLFQTTAEIAAAAAAGRPWRVPTRDVTPQTWATAARSLYDAMQEAIARCDYHRVQARVLRLDGIVASEPTSPAPPRPPTVVAPEDLRRLQPSFAAHAAGLVTGGPPAAWAVIADGRHSNADLMIQLLHRAETLGPDGLLILDAPALQIDTARAKRLLIAAGLIPGAAETVDGRLRIAARTFVPWASSTPLDGEDQGFIAAAYLAVFGREADPTGLTNYLDALKRGLSRRDLLMALYASAERLDCVARLHGALR